MRRATPRRCGRQHWSVRRPLIQHLLAFARKQPLRPRNIDINNTIIDIARLLRPTLGEHIEINSILEEEVATEHIDASQLANSLVNMAINARDAMPSGGTLLLERRNVVLDEAYAEANPEVAPGPYLMLAVSDTGTGMPAAVRERVFKPFFTTLADEVERLRRDARVLFTSGYTDNAIIHHGRLDDGVLLLSKPYRKSELARMVRFALGDVTEIKLAEAS